MKAFTASTVKDKRTIPSKQDKPKFPQRFPCHSRESGNPVGGISRFLLPDRRQGTASQK
jgi:hypothetical protein